MPRRSRRRHWIWSCCRHLSRGASAVGTSALPYKVFHRITGSPDEFEVVVGRTDVATDDAVEHVANAFRLLNPDTRSWQMRVHEHARQTVTAMLLEVEHVVSTRFEGVCDCADLHLDSNHSAIGACEEDVRSMRHSGVGRSDIVVQQSFAFAFAAAA